MSRNPYVDINANNHGGNKQSQQANIRVAPGKLSWKERILGLMSMRDEQGLGTSLRHAKEYFSKESGQLSGRFSELKADGLIEETQVVEQGYMVYRLPNSPRVSVNKSVRKRLLVVGPGLAGEIVFEKSHEGWQIARITPKLKGLLAETPVLEIGKRIDELGLTRTWVEA